MSLEGARQVSLKACAYFQQNKAICSASTYCFYCDSDYSNKLFSRDVDARFARLVEQGVQQALGILHLRIYVFLLCK